MNYPAVAFWALIAWSVTASRCTLLTLLLASMPFAGLALSRRNCWNVDFAAIDVCRRVDRKGDRAATDAVIS